MSQHDEHYRDHQGHEGLTLDLDVMRRVMQRRQLLRLATGAGLATFIGCKAGESMLGGERAGAAGSAGDGDGDGGGSTESCEEIPDETAGPYPGDGSNGPNALAQSGIVRSDMRGSLGGSAVAEGVPLTVKLTLVDGSCVALSGCAIYLWHCDREGRYSMYSQGVESETYLRAVQETDDEGSATFTTIFPGCYAGRWPHMHFEIFAGLAAASAHGNAVKTSQLALPEAACNAVYAEAGYEASARNLTGVPLARDNVFSDGVVLQMASLEGSVEAGFTATLTVAIDL